MSQNRADEDKQETGNLQILLSFFLLFCYDVKLFPKPQKCTPKWLKRYFNHHWKPQSVALNAPFLTRSSIHSHKMKSLFRSYIGHKLCLFFLILCTNSSLFPLLCSAARHPPETVALLRPAVPRPEVSSQPVLRKERQPRHSCGRGGSYTRTHN